AGSAVPARVRTAASSVVVWPSPLIACAVKMHSPPATGGTHGPPSKSGLRSVVPNRPPQFVETSSVPGVLSPQLSTLSRSAVLAGDAIVAEHDALRLPDITPTVQPRSASWSWITGSMTNTPLTDTAPS